MVFRQITHDDLGCASYLVGDEKAGIAAVVDPPLEIVEYLELARYGAREVLHVVNGGVPKWGREGDPLEQGETVAAR